MPFGKGSFPILEHSVSLVYVFKFLSLSLRNTFIYRFYIFSIEILFVVCSVPTNVKYLIFFKVTLNVRVFLTSIS